MKVYLVQYRSTTWDGKNESSIVSKYKTDLAFEVRQHAQEYRKKHVRRGRIVRSSKRALERHNNEHINQVHLVPRFEVEDF